MYMLYLDESGSVTDPNQKYFVLAGVCVFERKTHWIEQELNAVASSFCPKTPYSIELHGSPMRSGRDGWNKFPLSDRLQAIKDALRLGIQDPRAKGATPAKGVRLFGAVVKKSSIAGIDPVEHAF